MFRFFSLHVKVIQKLQNRSIAIKELNTRFAYKRVRIHKMESTNARPNGLRKHATLRKAGIRNDRFDTVAGRDDAIRDRVKRRIDLPKS